jgi:hypothetical protein
MEMRAIGTRKLRIGAPSLNGGQVKSFYAAQTGAEGRRSRSNLARPKVFEGKACHIYIVYPDIFHPDKPTQGGNLLVMRLVMTVGILAICYSYFYICRERVRRLVHYGK